MFISCAAALVPETNDPGEKLKQSYSLISNKRGIAAEKVINDALRMYQKRGDQEGLANCYYAYALLYRSDVSHHELKLPNYKLASQNYLKAAPYLLNLKKIELYAQTISLAAMFEALGTKPTNTSNSCQMLTQAKKVIGTSSREGLKILQEQFAGLRCF